MTLKCNYDKKINYRKNSQYINKLPESKAKEISDFADYLIKRYEEQTITEGIQKIIAEGKSFDFLKNEEDLYSEKDLKMIFGEKG